MLSQILAALALAPSCLHMQFFFYMILPLGDYANLHEPEQAKISGRADTQAMFFPAVAKAGFPNSPCAFSKY